MGLGVAKYRVCVSAVAGLDLGKLSEKSSRDCTGEFHVHFRMFKSSGIRSSLEDEVAQKRTRLLGGLDLHVKCV